ncbi:MAG: T9SS type A sorting domain-containing protein [Bacteroidota bacterium]
MKGIFFILLSFFATLSVAQEAQRTSLGMAGSNASVEVEGKTYYVLSSVGQQSVIGVASNDAFTLRQGYQQPPIRVVGTTNVVDELDAIVFPNPTSAQVTVRFGAPVTTDILSTLYDTQGREIERRIIPPTQTFNLDLSSLATGAYILHLRIQGDAFTTQLIKN